VNLDVLAAAVLSLVLAWLLWFAWGVVRGDARNGWWRAARILGAAVIALVAVGAATYQLMNSRTVQLLGDHVAHVETPRKVVAVTFDDGPNDLFVTELIADLERFRAKGTFYVVGAAAADHPYALAALVATGHEIGNHSFTHQRLVFVRTAMARDEVDSTDEVIRGAGFAGPITFRPPYAKKLLSLPWVLWRADRTTVMWDLEPDSLPIAADPAAMTRYVLDNVRPGSIILLHPWSQGNTATREALPMMLAGLREQGYRFVTVSELLALR
jgi:peptidoglycan/xylan/chitin deacetylase (PgdA/CDA1 family)